MASVGPFKSQFLVNKPLKHTQQKALRKLNAGFPRVDQKKQSLSVKAALGDLSSDSTTYLIAGAAVVALLGTAFPVIFSRKDTCPECDGAGFVRKSGGMLRVNAARKDQAQIVCANCNGLGKLNQIDK